MPEVPLTFVTDTLEQVAVTADAGTVVHPVNVDDPAWIPTVQVFVVAPPLRSKAMEAAEDPVTNPKSGSVAEKLIVAGVADSDVTLVAKTTGVVDGATMVRPLAATVRTCALTKPLTGTVVSRTSTASWIRETM